MAGVPLGHHIILDLFDCECDEEWLARVSKGHELMVRCAEKLNTLNISAHQFEPVSYSIVVLLSESHLSIHTWTEKRHASLDFYTCTGKVPDECVDIALEVLRPKRAVRVDIIRGTTNPITRTEVDYHAGQPSHPGLDESQLPKRE